MTDQKDTFRAAQIIITQHGANAEKFALSRMEYFMKIEDVNGASMWLMIAQAIAKIVQDYPSGAIH